MSTDIIVKNGYMYRGWRRPVNTAASMMGSLRDNEAAQKLGWRGGAVADVIHLNLFPPLLIELFGQCWFNLGSISMFYTYAITDHEEVNKALETITDPLDWYKGGSPWGKAILPLATMQSALNIGFIGGGDYEAAAFYGAAELCNVDGPVKVGVPYRTTGKIACIGASPKTEFAWIDSCLEEKGTGRKVAEMRHMTQWLKASSQLYRDSS